MNRNHWINLSLFFASIVFALLVGEVLVRVIHRELVTPDAILLHRPNPGVGEWDARGFRNKEAMDQADIVTLGDSLTEGFNAKMDDAWPQALGEFSSQKVYNMGVGGYGPVQEAVLTDEAITLKPKLVIVGSYLGNDFFDALNVAYSLDYWESLRDEKYDTSSGIAVPTLPTEAAEAKGQIESGLSPKSFAYASYKIRLLLRNNSKLYKLLGDATRSWRERTGIVSPDSTKWKNIENFALENPDIAFLYQSVPEIRTVLGIAYRAEQVNLHNVQTAEGWRITKGRYREIHRKLEESGTPLVVVIIPTKEYIYFAHMRQKGEKLSPAMEKLYSDEQETIKEVERFLEQEHILSVDVSNALVEALGNGQKVFEETTESHPRGEGYRVMAESISRYLEKQGMASSFSNGGI